jgi:hypothetical protein
VEIGEKAADQAGKLEHDIREPHAKVYGTTLRPRSEPLGVLLPILQYELQFLDHGMGFNWDLAEQLSLFGLQLKEGEFLF